VTGRRVELADPLERYVDGHELARLMGVSTTTLKRWRAEGMPCESWGMSRTRRYRPSQVLAWAAERGSRLAAESGRTATRPDTPEGVARDHHNRGSSSNA
jgi:phage terminase Nu1 subunit (DNA packaging protein)